MASSKVMASSSTSTNSDLARQTSTYSLSIGGDLQVSGGDPAKFGSMSMDELMRGLYGDNTTNSPVPCTDMIVTGGGGGGGGGNDMSVEVPPPPPPPTCLSRQGSLEIGNKTAEEVWKEISGGGGGEEKVVSEMTLEEFLAKAGAVREEDMKIPQMVGAVHGFVVDPPIDTRYPQQSGEGGGGGSGSILWLGNGGDRAGGGRGKRRAVMEPVDKVAQQRQKRMIKNRESAARSRERKQAYTVELESLVTQLEEENARLQREEVERNSERYKQLMEHLVPIDEKRRPLGRPVLRRSNSSHW